MGFINGLSHHLASRYHRSVSSIAVTLHHSSCMLFGGTFDKAYVMTISAIPCELQPATNKRNAAVVQGFMTEILGIPPCRGLLRFVPVAEECWAFDSRTVSGEMDDVERSSSESATAVPDKEKPGSPRSARKRISMKVGKRS